jgi:5'-3' exonuclease
MGIPLYFKSIYDDYPDIIINDIDGLSNLFLDLNCAIHPCCANILSNYNSQEITKANLEKKMINETINYIEFILSKVNPKLLYVAIDGVAPLAKMNQQRLRRYKSIFEKKQINSIKEELNIPLESNSWDKNAISPGTEFMDKLIKQLNSYLKTLKEKNKNITIIFSSSYINGEGEHKILNYIRNNELSGNIIIYGLDADLIMLAMASHRNNVYLLREAIEFGKKIDNKLLYLDINLFKNRLIGSLKEKLNVIDNGFFLNDNDSLRMIDDYIFMCFLMGNDFLPHNLAIDLRYDGHDIILDAYLNNYSINKEFLVDTGKMRINNSMLYSLLTILHSKEDDQLVKIQKRRNRFRMNTNMCETEFDRRMLLIKNDPIINNYEERKVDFSNKYWRNKYYKQCFDIEDSEEIEEVCYNYFEGLKWTFFYYFKECVSYEWKYNYVHPPTLLDLKNYLVNHDINKIKFNRGTVNHTIVQLLSILPQESKDLVPIEYRKLMNKSSEIGIYYPSSYKLDKFFKRYDWMCVPILPDLDINIINKFFRKVNMSKTIKERFSNNSKLLVF